MRSRPSPAAALSLAALAVFTIWITWRAKRLETGSQDSEAPVALLHKPAPDFSLPTLDGRTISLANSRGKNLVVSFWASWCGPCRLELPVLRSFYQRAHKADSDFDILTINLDDEREAAQRAANELKLPFPVLLDPQQKSVHAYGVFGIPMLFVIGKDGRVSYSTTGFNPSFEVMLATQLGIDPKVLAEGGPNAKPGN